MSRITPIFMMTLSLVIALTLTGCSVAIKSNAIEGNHVSLNNKTNEVSESEASRSDVAVTIKMMHLWSKSISEHHNLIVNQIIESYQNENPHVKVEQQILENEQYKNKLKVISASNELPDVGMTWAAGFLQPYVKGNLFAPLDDVLDSGLREHFVSGTTEAYAVDGTTYALPLELNITPIYYNKTIFKQYGLRVPETYEEFKHVVLTLVDHGVAPIALGNKEPWTGSLWYMYLADRLGGPQTLNNAINRTGTFEDPSLIQAAAEVQHLVDMNAFIKGFNGLSNDEGKSKFMNNRAAMFLMGSWELPNFTTNESIPQHFRDSIGFFKFPTLEGGKGNVDSWVGGPGVGLFVAEHSEVKEEAKQFIAYFVEMWGALSITEAGVISATKVDTSTIDLPDLYIAVLDELNNASHITLFADVQMSPGVAQEHLNMIQALFGDQVTPEQFARKHEETLAAESGN